MLRHPTIESCRAELERNPAPRKLAGMEDRIKLLGQARLLAPAKS